MFLYHKNGRSLKEFPVFFLLLTTLFTSYKELFLPYKPLSKMVMHFFPGQI